MSWSECSGAVVVGAWALGTQRVGALDDEDDPPEPPVSGRLRSGRKYNLAYGFSPPHLPARNTCLDRVTPVNHCVVGCNQVGVIARARDVLGSRCRRVSGCGLALL